MNWDRPVHRYVVCRQCLFSPIEAGQMCVSTSVASSLLYDMINLVYGAVSGFDIGNLC